MKESWKTIKELLNKRSKSSSIDCLKESGTETRNEKDVFNAMTNLFCTIGRDLVDKIQPAANPLLSGEYEINKDKAKFHFKTIEIKDLDKLSQIKFPNYFEYDKINAACSYFVELITNIINEIAPVREIRIQKDS